MEFLRTLDGTQAYALLCGLILVEEAGVPLPFLPGDAILLAAGYLAATQRIGLGAFLALAYAAAVVGAVACHQLSGRLGRPMILRLGRRLHLTPARLAAAERWLARAGPGAIAVARVLPGTRINSSIAAGCLRMPLRTFLTGVLPSTALWLGGFVVLGYAIGDRATPILPWVDRVIAFAAVAAAVVAAAVWLRRRAARRRAPAAELAPAR